VLFLHGLTGVAEVWLPTISELPQDRNYLALDQRGHGQSPSRLDLDYRVAAFVEDVRQLIEHVGAPVHLVGHSMGARVAMVFAARHPRMLRSVAIVDIGPEASRQNIRETISGISRRAERFANEAEALTAGFRRNQPSELDQRVFLSRLNREADGSLTWRAPTASLTAIVTAHRARSYWREWRSISLPALLIRGGTSTEVSAATAAKMRAENPAVRYQELAGIGHNIPLLAPDQLAGLLSEHWNIASRDHNLPGGRKGIL
jgi:pimeloyl-ACP methyl ester carboxylesterase